MKLLLLMQLAEHQWRSPRLTPFSAYIAAFRSTLIDPAQAVPSFAGKRPLTLLALRRSPSNQLLRMRPGGEYPGIVTWVDNLWIAPIALPGELPLYAACSPSGQVHIAAHIWGFGYTVVWPLLAAHIINGSIDTLGLPVC
jgi:hypothetical protein